MAVVYNQIAARSLDRIAALSDGLFAIGLVFGTLPAVVAIVLVQLNFAIAPRFWVLNRI